MQILNPTPVNFLFLFTLLALASCQRSANENDMNADLILHHAFVYPVTGDPIEDGAVVIVNGKIVDSGLSIDMIEKWGKAAKEKIDCQGAFLMPGFIEGHGHYSGLGRNLLQLDLLDTKNWEEIIDSVKSRVAISQPGDWIIGRGWHQEKWAEPVNPNVNGYPFHDALSAISPDNPVMLTHASGHSLLANQRAMMMANITNETPDPEGGMIVRDQRKNALGVFEENAMELISSVYKSYQASLTDAERKQLWLKAVRKVPPHCLSQGITSFQDAGSTFDEIKWYRELAEHDGLDIRLWAMLLDSLVNLKGHMEGYPIIRAGDDKFTCRTIKAYIDGALGSYGAWLLAPYVERPGFTGQNTTEVEEIKGLAELCMQTDMQFAVHAIGDKANRTVLDIYEETFEAHPDKKDLRWRIEHAQHIDPADIPRFKSLGVIASMQAIHCTSDAPFVVKRLGEERARSGAYPWRSLLDSGAVLANGTDVPVERADPIPNFYASVTRKRLDNGMEFFPEQAMTRKEALHSLTLANAYAAFEEDVKGSIEVGKWADLVLLSQNLLTCAEDSISGTKVIFTMVGGEVKYRN